jgi:hypothetical protein
MKRTRAVMNLTSAKNENVQPAKRPATKSVSMTPSVNSNSEEDYQGNIAIQKIEELEQYIRDNYTVVKKPSVEGPSLRISTDPGKFIRISDSKEFDRVYSSYADLYYPDGDEYVMRELGIPINASNNSKSRKSRKGRKGRKSRKTKGRK